MPVGVGRQLARPATGARRSPRPPARRAPAGCRPPPRPGPPRRCESPRGRRAVGRRRRCESAAAIGGGVAARRVLRRETPPATGASSGQRDAAGHDASSSGAARAGRAGARCRVPGAGRRLGAGRGARRRPAARHRRPAGRRCIGPAAPAESALAFGSAASSTARLTPASWIRYGSRSRSSVASADGSGRSRAFPSMSWSKYSLHLESRPPSRARASAIGGVGERPRRRAPSPPSACRAGSRSWRCSVAPLRRRDRDLGRVGLRAAAARSGSGSSRTWSSMVSLACLSWAAYCGGSARTQRR